MVCTKFVSLGPLIFNITLFVKKTFTERNYYNIQQKTKTPSLALRIQVSDALLLPFEVIGAKKNTKKIWRFF